MYSKIKRIFDIIFSFLLLIFLAPLFSLIYLVLLFTTGSPVFFTQIRIGRLGRKFKLYKFRTMKNRSAGNKLLVTPINDCRITFFGKYLRRFKFDELPQIFNIFIGDMSFVGPRPEVPTYYSIIPLVYKKYIQTIKPGLTDFATLHFINESSILSRSANPEDYYCKNILPKKSKLQYYYFVKRSFLVDVTILFKTFFAIIH